MIPKTEPGMSRTSPLPTSNNTPEILNDIPTVITHVPQNSCHSHPTTRLVEFTPEEKARLNVDLPKYLAPEFAATRAGPGRTTLTYIEGWRIKNLANKLFGFNGWSSSITDVTVDFLDLDHEGKVSVGVSVMVKVTLKDGTFHEDIGYGSSENQKSKAASFEKAKKEATTDGLKRALTSFGNVLGTCLYDKNFCKYLSTQKVDKPKFDSKEIYYCPTEAQPTPQDQERKQQQQQQQQQRQHQNQYQHNNQHNYQHNHNLNQNQQQISHGAGPSSAIVSEVIPNPYQAIKSRLTIPNPPQVALDFPGRPKSAASSIVTRTNVNNQAQNETRNGEQRNTKAEDDDDMFFGADFEEPRASQPESPRMSDFDFHMDVMEMMVVDDSPVKPAASMPTNDKESNGSAGAGARPPSLRRSGTFSRSTSSPSIVQTTPTKTAPSLTPQGEGLKQEQMQAQKPVPFRMAVPPNDSLSSSSSALSSNPFAPKESLSSPPLSIQNTTSTKPSTPSAPHAQDGSHSSRQANNIKHHQNQSLRNGKEIVSPFAARNSNSPQGVTVNGTRNVLRANSMAAAAQGHATPSLPPTGQNNTVHGHKPGTYGSSTAQHSVHLLNPAQGTGLKRPLGMTSVPDGQTSAVHKEARLR